jgi:hypothetical protein
VRVQAFLCFLLTASILAPALTIAPDANADTARPPAKGDMWEVTSQMSMEGMPMALPSQKVKVCSQKVWKEPPGGADERRKCSNSDFKMSGSKATWKVTCVSPRAMTGEGEILREGSDSWSGTITFASSDGAMTVKLSGRLLGDCENPQ